MYRRLVTDGLRAEGGNYRFRLEMVSCFASQVIAQFGTNLGSGATLVRVGNWLRAGNSRCWGEWKRDLVVCQQFFSGRKNI